MILSRFPRLGWSPTLRRLGFEPLERRMAMAVGGVNLESFSQIGGEDGDTIGMDSRPVLDGADVQQMPSVAVNPLDAKHVVMVAMDRSLVSTGYAGLRTAVSKDGGDSWQTGFVPLPERFAQGASNPIVKFNADGRVYLSYMATTFLGPLSTLTNPHLSRADLKLPAERALGFQANNGIFVTQSPDGGLTWGPSAAVTSNLYDGKTQVPFDIMPDLAIDTFRTLPNGAANPNFGRMYVVFSRYYPSGQFPGQPAASGGSRILLGISDDQGQSWSLARDAKDQVGLPAVPIPIGFGLGQAPPGLGSVNWTHITVGPEGDLYVSMFNFDAFEVYHSKDGGRSFTPPDLATGRGFPFGTEQSISPSSTRGLPNSRFRTQVQRAIAADPTRPGRIYAAEAMKARDVTGGILDPADIIFSRSNDYGRTWQTVTRIGSRNATVLNDDNDGQRAKGLDEDVVNGQALVRLSVDESGNIGLIWYDTRRDPGGRRLDLYGTISKDGGESFLPNFRLSDRSFNSDLGKFTDPTKADNFYLGDFLGLAFGDENAYAAWTNVGSNSQDVWVSRFRIDTPPAPANDRFEPNETAVDAVDLGNVVARQFPKLSVGPGDEDWYRANAIATGELNIVALAESASSGLRVEIWDAQGNRLLRSSDSVPGTSGVPIGQRVSIPCRSGETFLIRVSSITSVVGYALDIKALTGDLGTDVYGKVTGSGKSGEDAYYLLRLPVDGALSLLASIGAPAVGSLKLEALNAKTLAVIDASVATASTETGSAGLSTRLSVSVQADQLLVLHVIVSSETSQNFELTYTNLDAYEALQQKVLRFPIGVGASQSQLADVNRDGTLDAVVSDPLEDVLSLLAGNGDGTFQSPREFRVGASSSSLGSDLELPTYRRDLLLNDFNNDGFLDAVTANYNASDISLLLGRGDGTFISQSRFNATAAPYALVSGDLNGDGQLDLVVHDSLRTAKQQGNIAVLMGRGNGTFRPQEVFSSPISTASYWPGMALGKIDEDDILDLVVIGDLETKGGRVLLGNGDGSFRAGPDMPLIGFGVVLADIDGDGKLDALAPNKYDNTLQYALNAGQGKFGKPVTMVIGQAPIALEVADLAGPPNAGGVLGAPDGLPDVVVANSGIAQPSFAGPAEIVILLGQTNSGKFNGFRSPIRLAKSGIPQDVDVRDVDRDGSLDAVVVDAGSLTVIYGREPRITSNNTPETARRLGSTYHLLQPAETIVPGHQDDYYEFIVPVESTGSLAQVVDVSVKFKFQDDIGLDAVVRDERGNVRGRGERIRFPAQQGERLRLHIFGKQSSTGERGTGSFVLAINVLPQVTSVRADALLPGVGGKPGGPTSSLVLSLQGDRLEPNAASNASNYQITYSGADGLPNTRDDRVIPIADVIYSPDTNARVSSGQSTATKVVQTIAFLFDQPLPAGSYSISVSPKVVSNPFNAVETQQLANVESFGLHTLVSLVEGKVVPGASLWEQDLVVAPGNLGDLNAFRSGTRFLTQLHADLSALLDDVLKRFGDQPTTEEVKRHIISKIAPALGTVGNRITNLLIVFLDPVSLSMVDPNGQRTVFDLQTNKVENNIPRSFMEVGGNIELLVFADAVGEYRLNVKDVPERARGMAILLDNKSETAIAFTASMRNGERDFSFVINDNVASRRAAPPLTLVQSTNSSPNEETDQAIAGWSSAAKGPSLAPSVELASGEFFDSTASLPLIDQAILPFAMEMDNQACGSTEFLEWIISMIADLRRVIGRLTGNE